jgi:hypothetical protein
VSLPTVESPEVIAAARWWRNAIGRLGTSGAGEIDAHAIIVREELPVLPKEKLDKFEAILRERIVAFLGNAIWNSEQPLFGGVNRIVATDYGPDGTLLAAAEEAGIEKIGSIFPMKTVMWINPGSVSVAYGYGAQEAEVYRKHE